MRSIVVCAYHACALSQCGVFVVAEEGGGIDAQAVYLNEGPEERCSEMCCPHHSCTHLFIIRVDLAASAADVASAQERVCTWTLAKMCASVCSNCGSRRSRRPQKVGNEYVLVIATSIDTISLQLNTCSECVHYLLT